MREFLSARTKPLLISPFTRSVGSMMAYTAIGHGIYVLASPLIGRLYAPEQMGLYGLFFTIAGTVAGFVCLLYDLAIPAAHSEEEARELTMGAALLALLLSSVVGIAMALCCWFGYLGMDQLPAWAGLLIALILILQIAIQLAQAWRVRRQETAIIGRSNVALNAGRSVTQITLAVLIPSWWALVLGELVGRVVSLWHLLRGQLLHGLQLPTPAGVAATLRRYREFPIVLLPAQLMDAVAILAQVSGLTMLFGPPALGQYFLMRRTLDLPIAFFFRSLSDVFSAKFSEYIRTTPERVKPFFVKVFLLLCAAGLLGGWPLILFGPELFTLVYGSGWEEAGALSAVMMPAAVLNLAVAPVSRVFALTTRPQLRFASSIVSTAGSLAVMVAAWRFSWTLWQTTAGLSATIALSYIVYFLAGYRATAHLRLTGPAEPHPPQANGPPVV